MSDEQSQGNPAALALPEGEALVWQALRSVRDFAIIVVDPDARVTIWNSGAEVLFGYRAAEILGQPLAITFTPEDRAANMPAKELGAARDNGMAVDERWHLRKDGSRIFASGKVTPIWSETGELLGFTKVCQDLTAEMQRRQTLEEAEERYRVLVELSPQVVWMGQADGQITYCNQRWYDLTGLSKEASLGDGWVGAVVPEYRERVLSLWHEAVRNGQDYETELPLQGRDGAVRWHLARGRPLRDDEGRVRRWMGSAVDIHERKMMEFADAPFRTLFESAPGLYVVLTPDDYTIVAASEAYLRATMTERARVTRQKFFSVFPDDPNDPSVNGARNLRASFERVKTLRSLDVMALQRYPIRRPAELGGAFEDRWWSSINSPVFGPQGEIIYIIHRVEDVTAFIRAKRLEGAELASPQSLSTRAVHMEAEIVLRALELQRANEQLRESEAQHRALFDVASVGLVQADPRDGRLLRVNGKFSEITGFSREELLAMHLHDFVHPEERVANWDGFQRAARGETPHHLSETRYVCRDQLVVWVRISAAFVRNAAGVASQTFAVVEDITARKEAERALREADRRKTEFLAMLAHELRNPLAAVRTVVQVCRETRSLGTYEWGLEVIERQGGLLTRLVDDLLDVSRITQGLIRLKKQRVDAAELIDHAVESVGPLLTERGHQLVLSYDPSGAGLPLEADPARLEQIIGNLLTNAAKYTDRHGRIELAAWREGAEIVLCVRDNGLGISPAKMPEMFKLFAQGERGLARSEGGLGVGLAIVRQLVEMHGGAVFAHSEGLGRGSEFIVRLPAAAEEPGAERLPARAASVPPQGAGARILIVEDNLDTAEAMARLLRRRHYQVEVSSDGPSGVDAAHQFHPDFVLLDIGLPGLDGYEVANRLRADPECREALIIALSGYGQEEDRRRSREAGFDYHLTKPVDFQELETLLLARAH